MLLARPLALGAAVLALGGTGALPEACNKVSSLLKPAGGAPPPDTAGPVASSSAPAPVATAALSPEEQAIADAKIACLQRGDCQTAHERLTITIPDGSPLRQRADYKDLENRWATTTINDAFNDPDVPTRRKLLEEVAASTVVDPALRDRAKQTLAKLPAAAASAGAVAATGPSDFDRAKKMSAKDPRGARDVLLPKVQDGTASKEERDLLASICKRIADKSCLATVAKR